MKRADDDAHIDVLIVAAHPLELAGLRSLGPALRGELRGLQISAATVGVGIAAAGSGTARLLSARRPRALILLGSCGLYEGSGALRPGHPFVPTRMCAVDSAVLLGNAAFPGPMPIACEPDAALVQGLCARRDAMRGALATTFAITTDDALARELARASSCAAENLEALAVGLACEAERVPFAAVLGCTNVVGSQGRAQWAEHHALAAEQTAAHLLDWIAGGASGLPARGPR